MDQALQRRQPTPPPSTCGKDKRDVETGPRGRGLLSLLHEATGRPRPRQSGLGPRGSPRSVPRAWPRTASAGVPPRGSHRVCCLDRGLQSALTEVWRVLGMALPGPYGDAGNVTALFLLLPGLAELGATPSSAGDAVQRGPSRGTADQTKCRSAPVTQAPTGRGSLVLERGPAGAKRKKPRLLAAAGCAADPHRGLPSSGLAFPPLSSPERGFPGCRTPAGRRQAAPASHTCRQPAFRQQERGQGARSRRPACGRVPSGQACRGMGGAAPRHPCAREARPTVLPGPGLRLLGAGDAIGLRWWGVP